MRYRNLWIGLALLMAAGASSANLYRWVDEQGVVHYSDQPRPGAEAVTLSGPRRGGDRAKAEGSREGADSRARRAEQIRAEECEKARKRLAEYREAATLTTTGPDGEQRTLTSEERVRAIARAEEDVAGLCGEHARGEQPK